MLRRRSRRWLSDTAGLPIGAVDRNTGLTRCRRWRTCWTGFRSGGTPALQPRKQCNGGSARCRAGAARLCRRAPGGRAAKGLRTRTDGAGSGRANSACHFRGRPHKCQVRFRGSPRGEVAHGQRMFDRALVESLIETDGRSPQLVLIIFTIIVGEDSVMHETSVCDERLLCCH
jgi:hypothetical protein